MSSEDKHIETVWHGQDDCLRVMHLHGGKLMLDIKTSYNSRANIVISKLLLSGFINILSLIITFKCSCKVQQSLQGNIV